MTPIGFEVLVLLVALALVFDFMNGFHDAANSIATVVSTRVLRPQFAVIWAAFFNFIAFLVVGLAVANTIGRGVIDGVEWINPANDIDGRVTWWDLLYFSFTTLTSTGYGEITPVTSHARSLVMLEQITGVMYVALLVARLANMLPARRAGR